MSPLRLDLTGWVKAHRLRTESTFDDLLETGEGATHHEQMLAVSMVMNPGADAFDHPGGPLATVPSRIFSSALPEHPSPDTSRCDRRVLSLARDLVDLVDVNDPRSARSRRVRGRQELPGDVSTSSPT